MSWVVTWEHDLFRLTLKKEIECNYHLWFGISDILVLSISEFQKM